MKARLKELIKKLIPQKMWMQMLIILVLLVSIPLATLGIMLMKTSQQAIKESVLRDHKAIVTRAAGEVEAFLNNPKNLLMNTASLLSTLHTDAWQQETVLVELALNHDIFGRISVLDYQGNEIVSSEPGTSPQNQLLTETTIQHLENDGLEISEVLISDRHMPYLMMSIPIKRFGKILNILKAEINVRGIWDIVDGITLDQTGHAYVVADNGILLAHKDKKQVLENKNLLSFLAVQEALKGNIMSMEEGEGEQGFLTSAAPIGTFGWGLVLTQSSNEAYAFLKTMKSKSWILMGLSLLAVGITSILIARNIVRPVKLLAKQTQAVANEEFTQMSVNRTDEIGDLMNSFNQMTEKLKVAKEEEHLTIIGKDARTIAHELKNSLILINTFIELFPERKNDPKFVEQFAKVVPKELERWKGMLQELSDFTKHTKVELSLIDVTCVLNDIALLAKEKTHQHNINLVMHYDESLPFIQGNAEKLKQVFMNIIINAIDAMPEGGSLTITVTTLREQGQHGAPTCLEIVVEDEGCGMEKTLQERIFEPFVSTKPSSLGLGLNVSRGIIQQHGGEIQCMSVPAKGTKFIIRLPLDGMTLPHLSKEEVQVYAGRNNSSHR